MSAQAFATNFPAPKTPLVDKGGLATQDGRFLWLAFFNRTGGADGIIPIVKTGLIAQGSSQTTALALGGDWNQVTSAPSPSISGPFSGVIIPSMSPGNDIWIWNADTNAFDTLNVYPFSSAQIGFGAANAAYQLGPGLLAYFQCWSTTQIIPIIKVNPLTL